MDINNAINALLVKFMKSTPNVKQIMLSDATGLIISKVTKGEGKYSDFEGIASISTALYLGMTELKFGKVGFSQAEFPDSNLCLFGVSKEYVLIAITHKNASIKKLKSSIKTLSVKISEQIYLLKASERIESKQNEFYEKSVGLSKDDYDKLLDELSF
ncbi:MAG: roadblock/LC7 domain-containing protein [Candidatus Hodarchaeales archaeon]